LNQAELAQPRRRRRVRHLPAEPERVIARLTVSWTPGHHDGSSSFTQTEVELFAGLEADSTQAWTCPESVGDHWIEAIASARSSEVLLTARVGNDLAAKHLALELAELLTFRLTDSQPLIRVLFVPTESASRGQRSHA